MISRARTFRFSRRFSWLLISAALVVSFTVTVGSQPAARAQEDGDKPAPGAPPLREKRTPPDRIKDNRRARVEVKGTPPAPAAPAVINPPPPALAGTPATATNPPGAGLDDSELYKCKRYPEDARIKVTLKPDTDLKDLVAWVMGFTCKSFLYGNAISGRASKVTIIAPSEMSPADAYKLFLVALQTLNLTIVPKGNTYEIVEAQRGRELPVPVYKNGEMAPAVDQVVRLVLRPAHISVDEISQVLNAMKTATGVITPIPNAGVVIITDYGSNIERMLDVVKEVDEQTAAEKIFIINLKSADATDMSTKLQDIFGIGKGGTASSRRPPRAARGPGAPAGQPAAPGAPARRRSAAATSSDSAAAPRRRPRSSPISAPTHSSSSRQSARTCASWRWSAASIRSTSPRARPARSTSIT